MKKIHFPLFFGLFGILIIPLTIFAAGPTPDEYFFRADTRKPKEIFITGFQTWATTRGVPENNDISAYLFGLSVQTDVIELLNAGWVSVSGNLHAATNYLNTEVVPFNVPPPIERQQFWVYQIGASQDAYSVNWMLESYIQQGESVSSQNTDRYSVLLATFSHEIEWIVRGGIPANQIQSASLFQFNPLSFDFEEVQNSQVNNPNYQAPPTPIPQEINPMLSESAPETLFGYSDPSQVAPYTSLGALFTLASSCTGTGASGIGAWSKLEKSLSIPKAPGCLYDGTAKIKLNLDNIPTVTSKLIFEDVTKNPILCLQPINHATPSLGATRSYAYFEKCQEGQQSAYYDQASRIVFPKDKYGLEVCLTAPENVVQGDSKWDWVQFWPCDIQNIYQKWTITNKKLQSYANPKIELRKSSGYGIMSKGNWYGNINLDQSSMTPNFFKSQSKIANHSYEIGLSYSYKGARYYPTLASVAYSSFYNNRTYHDPISGRIFILSYYYQSPSAQGWEYNCLVSQQAGTSYDWHWTRWDACNPHDANIPKNQKWKIIHPVKGDIQYSNTIKDNDGNVFFVDNYGASANFGDFYTANSRGPQEGIQKIELLRMYGICGNGDTWKKCHSPKHSVEENDFSISSGFPIPPKDNGRCEHLDQFTSLWTLKPDIKHKKCIAYNTCDRPGGACYRWNQSSIPSSSNPPVPPKADPHCERLTPDGLKWVRDLYYRTHNECTQANNCNGTGTCYRWNFDH